MNESIKSTHHDCARFLGSNSVELFTFKNKYCSSSSRFGTHCFHCDTDQLWTHTQSNNKTKCLKQILLTVKTPIPHNAHLLALSQAWRFNTVTDQCFSTAASILKSWTYICQWIKSMSEMSYSQGTSLSWSKKTLSPVISGNRLLVFRPRWIKTRNKINSSRAITQTPYAYYTKIQGL